MIKTTTFFIHIFNSDLWLKLMVSNMSKQKKSRYIGSFHKDAFMVENTRFELVTPCLQSRCSPI